MPRVLIVEDDPDLLFLYQTALTHNGFEVVNADDAHSAMAHLDNQKFDAIILDLNLPDAHGSVVIDHMTQNNHHSPSRVVVITANDHWVGNIHDRGVRQILVKPVSMTRVVEVVSELIQEQPSG